MQIRNVHKLTQKKCNASAKKKMQQSALNIRKDFLKTTILSSSDTPSTKYWNFYILHPMWRKTTVDAYELDIVLHNMGTHSQTEAVAN